MNGAFLYQWVLATDSGERRDAIQALNHASLCRLAEWLSKEEPQDESTSEVLSLCLVEGFSRFVKEWRGQDVPATFEEEQRRKVREVMG